MKYFNLLCILLVKYLFVLSFEVSFKQIKLHHAPDSRIHELRAACNIGQMVNMHWRFSVCLWSRIEQQNIIIILGNDIDLPGNSHSLPLSFSPGGNIC